MDKNPRVNATLEPTDMGLVCTWLGLPAGNWPDHYTLLGLARGESDLARIEQQVHDRLTRLRCYQCSHPAAATAAMNRLAQAFLCLSDSASRKAYNATLEGSGTATSGTLPRKPPETTKAAVLKKPADAPRMDPSLVDTAVSASPQTQVDWHTVPPPVRNTAGTQATMIKPPGDSTVILPPRSDQQPTAAPDPSSASDSSLRVPVSAPADPVFEAAHASEAARRGLGTLRSLYERLVVTRQLLQAWLRAGRYLAKSKRQLTRAIEEADLTRQLGAIDDLLPSFPKILGRPGQPGYRVASMARLETGTLLFRAMDAAQRDALAKDWRAGHLLLLSHQQFLRDELKTIKRQGWVGQAVRAVRGTVNDFAFWILLGLVLLIVVLGVVYFTR